MSHNTNPSRSEAISVAMKRVIAGRGRPNCKRGFAMTPHHEEQASPGHVLWPMPSVRLSRRETPVPQSPALLQ
jgi:hypothetical protein